MTHAPLERAATAAPAPVTNLVPGAKARQTNWRRLLLLTGPIVLVLAGGLYYLFDGRYVSTDNAYVKSRMVTVTADMAGRVVAVPVNDNQNVKKGDVLLQIDPDPYRMKLSAAEADLGRTTQEINAARATVKSRQQDLAQANTDVAYYQSEFQRQSNLVKSGAVARSGYDKAERDIHAAQDRVSSLEQQIRSSLAQLSGNIDTPIEQLPSYLSAKATRDMAAYNLDHTTVRAPGDGRVGTVSVRPGEYVSPGQSLFPEVITSDTWVEANLRETDLTHVRDGQPATFTVDACPGQEYKAKVQSFSPATGSELSVLPAENATGNWVKIVQRLPVKLIPEEAQAGDHCLRAGLSVTVEIDTGTYHNMPRFLRGSSGADAAEPK